MLRARRFTVVAAPVSISTGLVRRPGEAATGAATDTNLCVRVVFNGEKRTVIDGPFAETKEVVAGFSIIKVSSKEEAIEWVKRSPNVAPNGRAVVEIRKLMDIEDFGESFTPNAEVAKVKFQ